MKKGLMLLGTVAILLLATRVMAQEGGSSSFSFGAAQDKPTAAHAGRDSATPSLSEGKGLLSTYSLTWWSVDGGGASSNSASSYSFGGTAGQPDAAMPRSSGGYTLYGGFWWSCASAVPTAILRTGSSVTLSWSNSAANQAYQVHRATTPYFTAADATLRTWVTAAPWNYPDPDPVIGNPNINYFYLVRAPCGAGHVDSDRMGEFDFRLVPGS